MRKKSTMGSKNQEPGKKTAIKSEPHRTRRLIQKAEPSEVIPLDSDRQVLLEEFSRRLQKKMREKFWTQADLARQCALVTQEKFGRDLISNWIRGRHEPRSDNLQVLCQALGCKMEDLWPEHGQINEIPLSLQVKDGLALLSLHVTMPWDVAMEINSILLRPEVRSLNPNMHVPPQGGLKGRM